MPSLQRDDIDHCKRYDRAQAYSDAILERWLTDFVPSLNCRSKWLTPSEQDIITRDFV